MGEALSTVDTSYLATIPADAQYVPGPYAPASMPGAESTSWVDSLKQISGAVTGAAGVVAKGYSKYSAYGREASYLNTEANLAALDARLAAQESDLYDLQGDTIAMQHEINRFQIREKYIKKFSESRAKYAKAGVSVWSGSSASVLSFILEEEEREEMVDRVNESGRMFTEVTLPKIRAENKAIAYGFKSATKESGADLMKDARKTTLLSDVVDFGSKLTEQYA